MTEDEDKVPAICSSITLPSMPLINAKQILKENGLTFLMHNYFLG